jgi:hypothetical protein
MENDFLDEIDEAFQRLTNNGNGKRNGHSISRSKEDRVVMEIIEQLRSLSKTQQEEVLKFVRTIERHQVE